MEQPKPPAKATSSPAMDLLARASERQAREEPDRHYRQGKLMEAQRTRTRGRMAAKGLREAK